MKRLAFACLLVSGCMSLDSMIITDKRVDHYELDAKLVPPEDLELVTFETPDGVMLYGVWAHRSGKPPLVFWHGNGGGLDRYIDRLDTYWSWDAYDVFMFDFRGYGMSGGEPTRDGILEVDGAAAMAYVSDTTGVALEDIPWISLSLGAAAAAHVNREVPASAVVYENMFPNASDLSVDGVQLDLPDGWFFRDVWDNVDALADVVSPLLIIHGLQDDFINPKHGVTEYERAPDNPKWLWRPPEPHHDDIHTVIPAEYRSVVMQFLSDPSQDPVPEGEGPP